MRTAARRNAPGEESLPFRRSRRVSRGMTAARDPRSVTNVGRVSFLTHRLDPARAPSRRPPIMHDPETLRDGDGKLLLTADGHDADYTVVTKLP